METLDAFKEYRKLLDKETEYYTERKKTNPELSGFCDLMLEGNEDEIGFMDMIIKALEGDASEFFARVGNLRFRLNGGLES